MANWDQFNPWRDKLVYVPLEILVHCCAGGMVRTKAEFADIMTTVPNDAAFILKSWKRYGDGVLDGYILPQPNRNHSIGVRYGAEGSQYLSPHNANPDLTHVLLHYYSQVQDVALPKWEVPNV